MLFHGVSFSSNTHISVFSVCICILSQLRVTYCFSLAVFPAVMVIISLSIAAGKDGIKSFVDDEHCWMSSANNLIWIFIAFVIIVEVLNILILVRVIREMTKMQQKRGTIQHVRLGIRTCVILLPLLGFTWLFGLLSPVHRAFTYIFIILNSTQGFLIFLLHCVRNSQIRDRLQQRIGIIFPATEDRNQPKVMPME